MTIATVGWMAASATGAMGASTGQVTGRIVGGALPTPGRGATIVDAIEPATSRIAASTRARRDGTFKLGAVRPGVIMVIVDVVRSGRAQVTAVSPAVRVRAGRRTSVRVSHSVHRPVLPTRRARARRAHGAARAAAAGPVIAVKRFAGSGPSSQLGHGLSSMLETDLVDQGPARCGAQVVEWEHRDLLQQEIDLQRRHRELFNPATIVAKHWLSPTVFIGGNVGTAADGTVAWDLKLVTRGGVAIGGDKGSVRGSEIFTATRAIAARLLTQLCPHLDPCALYSPAQAQALLRDIVAGRRPVEDIQTLHGSHPRRGRPRLPP